MKALLLAAHGSDSEPVTNRRITNLAQLLQRQIGVPVGVGFHKGLPHFSSALDTLLASHDDLRDVTVVPLMSSAGYYCTTVLPRELARNASAGALSVAVSEPVGTAAGLAGLVLGRIRELGHPGAAVLLVGHGTLRHPESRKSTEALALALRGELPEVAVAFLDESPSPLEALASVQADTVVVVPFMLGVGPHVAADIPTSLSGSSKTIVIDIPVGSYPGLAGLILQVAEGAKQWL